MAKTVTAATMQMERREQAEKEAREWEGSIGGRIFTFLATPG